MGKTGVTLQGWSQTLPQPWARSTSAVLILDMMWWKWHFIFLVYLPKSQNLNLIMRKNIRKIPTEGHSSKLLTNLPQNCQGHQRREKSEKPSQPTGAKRTWILKAIRWSWLGSWIRNWAFGKDQGDVNEPQTIIRIWAYKTTEVKMHWICMFNWGRIWNKI